jgi:hypothetical protein
LSLSTLLQILNIPRITIKARLDILYSVLSVLISAVSPIRLLYLSFRDLLLDLENREINPF